MHALSIRAHIMWEFVSLYVIVHTVFVSLYVIVHTVFVSLYVGVSDHAYRDAHTAVSLCMCTHTLCV